MSNEKIAYILKGFPRLSESFIANEVKLLSRMGLNLELFSIKTGDALVEIDNLPTPHYLPSVSSVSAINIFSWLKGNFASFRSAQAFWLTTAPRRYVTTLIFALVSARRYRGAAKGVIKKSFIKEFLFASYIARQIQEDGNIVHLHAHFCHDATTVSWMVSKLTQIPFSFTAHAKDIYQAKLNPGNLLDRKLEAAQFAVTCTQANVDHLRRKTSAPDRVHGIYHGLDTELFVPGSNELVGEFPVILSVGRMVEKKGFAYLIEACRILKSRKIKFALRIIGEEGDQTDLIKEKITEYALQDSVEICAPMGQRELALLYRQANVFVLPCIIVSDGDRDGIPNVMAEAMASGLPIIATPISGIPEIVVHGQNGLLVNPEDANSIADALEELFNRPQLREALGSAAREKILQVFDADETHLHLKKLFLDVISERKEIVNA